MELFFFTYIFYFIFKFFNRNNFKIKKNNYLNLKMEKENIPEKSYYKICKKKNLKKILDLIRVRRELKTKDKQKSKIPKKFLTKKTILSKINKKSNYSKNLKKKTNQKKLIKITNLKITQKSKKKLNNFLYVFQNFKNNSKKNKNNLKNFLENSNQKIKNYNILKQNEKQIKNKVKNFMEIKLKNEIKYSVDNFSLLENNVSFNYLNDSGNLSVKKKFSINKNLTISDYLYRYKEFNQNLKFEKNLENLKLKKIILKEKNSEKFLSKTVNLKKNKNFKVNLKKKLKKKAIVISKIKKKNKLSKTFRKNLNQTFKKELSKTFRKNVKENLECEFLLKPNFEKYSKIILSNQNSLLNHSLKNKQNITKNLKENITKNLKENITKNLKENLKENFRKISEIDKSKNFKKKLQTKLFQNIFFFYIKSNNQKQIIKMLKKNENLKNSKDQNENYPIFYTINRNFYNLTKILIIFKCDLLVKNKINKNCLEISYKKNSLKFVKVFLLAFFE